MKYWLIACACNNLMPSYPPPPPSLEKTQPIWSIWKSGQNCIGGGDPVATTMTVTEIFFCLSSLNIQQLKLKPPIRLLEIVKLLVMGLSEHRNFYHNLLLGALTTRYNVFPQYYSSYLISSKLNIWNSNAVLSQVPTGLRCTCERPVNANNKQ